MSVSDGAPLIPSECLHHRDKFYRLFYNCCCGTRYSPGCQVAKGHVVDRYAVTESELKVAENADSCSGLAVYAVDTEQCYTTMGLELTRVSLVNWKNEVCLDELVKPKFPVVDYNTYFSGITEESLKNVTVDLAEVQKRIFGLVKSSTILIGHSLDADLTTLQMKHSLVVDTSVLFPHRRGLPFKRALRNLARDHLALNIQNRDEGHSSTEDAETCVKLLLCKMKLDGLIAS